jgi:hypothetical protein
MTAQVEAGGFYEGAFAITPGTSFPVNTTCRAIYVGTAGNINLTTAAGQALVFNNVPVGVLPVSVSAVASGSTTASNLIGLY